MSNETKKGHYGSKWLWAILAVAILLTAWAVYAGLRCDYCGGEITGKYVVHNGKNYHPRCYEDHIALRCDLCGKIIEGRHLTDYWGDHYCASHEGNAPQCLYCGRFIGDKHNRGGQTYPDGRTVCNLCLASAINNRAEAELIFDEVKMRLGQLGIIIVNDRIKLHLADRNKLARYMGDEMASANESGFVEHKFTRRADRAVDQSFDIYILDGMPRMHFIATAAHELMHVWQYLNCPLDNDVAMCEGSCNYAAYLVLRQIGGREAGYIVETFRQSDDPIYGEGFRRVSRYTSRTSTGDLLDHLKSSKYFPAGY